jgi:hypothetical protein
MLGAALPRRASAGSPDNINVDYARRRTGAARAGTGSW